MSPSPNNPLTLSHRTTIILLATLPAITLFALFMGAWHCVRKYNGARRKAAEDEEQGRTLRQRVFLAVDSELPERSRSTKYQVLGMRVPGVQSLSRWEGDAGAPVGAQGRSAAAGGVVGGYGRWGQAVR